MEGGIELMVGEEYEARGAVDFGCCLLTTPNQASESARPAAKPAERALSPKTRG